MKRSSIIIPIVAVLALVGAVWALSPFPNSSEFPTLPQSPGTIGGALTSWFDITTGTAKDGAALDGQSATTYLQGSNCAQFEFWKGIDTSGKAICKGPPLMLAVIHEGTMSVNGVMKTPGTILREGDRIETNATQTGTIKFYNNPATTPTGMGDSIARLGTSTKVYIDRGDALGTLALVNLEDGLLWGRVLSSTGIDFGGGGIIAGVRGTSIALEKVAGQPLIRMIVPHSRNSADAAILRGPTPTGGTRNMAKSTAMYYNSGIIVPNGPASALYAQEIYNKPLLDLYNNLYNDRLGLSQWIRENTQKDLTYLYGLGMSPLIQQEIAATEPIVIADRRAVCGAELGDNGAGTGLAGSGVWYNGTGTGACVYAYADYSEDTSMHLGMYDIDIDKGPENLTTIVRDNGNFAQLPDWNNSWSDAQGSCWREENPNTKIWRLQCLYDNTHWQGEDDGKPFSRYIQDKITAGYSHIRVDKSGAFRNGKISGWDNWTYPGGITFFPIVPPVVTSGILIDGTGELISYSDLNLSDLAGKTITIEFDSLVTAVNTPLLVLDATLTGTLVQYFSIDASGTFICRPAASGCSVNQVGSTYTLSLGNMTPTQFRVGNNIIGTKPIGKTIKKITIK